MAEKKPTGTVLVAGAGISGIKAAIELAESGYKVILTDDSPQMGGILAKLDYQFPTDHCGMCRMLPLVGREYASQYCMRKSLFHENIEILPFTEITSVYRRWGELQGRPPEKGPLHRPGHLQRDGSMHRRLSRRGRG